MCVPIFCKKFSVGREFFISPTLNIIQPKFTDFFTYTQITSLSNLYFLVILVKIVLSLYKITSLSNGKMASSVLLQVLSLYKITSLSNRTSDKPVISMVLSLYKITSLSNCNFLCYTIF